MRPTQSRLSRRGRPAWSKRTPVEHQRPWTSRPCSDHLRETSFAVHVSRPAHQPALVIPRFDAGRRLRLDVRDGEQQPTRRGLELRFASGPSWCCCGRRGRGRGGRRGRRHREARSWSPGGRWPRMRNFAQAESVVRDTPYDMPVDRLRNADAGVLGVDGCEPPPTLRPESLAEGVCGASPYERFRVARRGALLERLHGGFRGSL